MPVETRLAERVAAELSRGRRRIEVRNVHSPDRFISRLSSLLNSIRILTFRMSSPEPLKETLYDYFAGSGVPDPGTAFEAGWISHVTEAVLAGGARGRGLENAASMNRLREPLENYLARGGTDTDFAVELLESFSLVLPTVFVLDGAPGEFPRISGSFPPVVVLSSGGVYSGETDLVLDSGLVSRSSLRKILEELKCPGSVEEAVNATGARAGLVRLYAGIRKEFPGMGGDVFQMLSGVFAEEPDLHRLAACASLFPGGFSPKEAAAASGVKGEDSFVLGRRIGLWKGFLAADFVSGRVKAHLCDSLAEEEADQLRCVLADTVLRVRGRNTVALVLAGDLFLSAGITERAVECFREAAFAAGSSCRKAVLFSRASGLARGSVRDDMLFYRDLNLFRDGRGPAPEHIPPGIDQREFPEISLNLSDAVDTLDSGDFHRGYGMLADFAVSSGKNLPVAMLELARYMLRSKRIDAAVNTAGTALHLWSRDGCSEWGRNEALVLLVKACTRAGRFQRAEAVLMQLMQVALGNSNRRMLVLSFNLYANILVLKMDYSGALAVYSSSLRMLEEGEERLRSVILNNMSVAQRKLLDSHGALESLMRMVRSSVSQGNLFAASTAYGNMARLFIDMSRFDSAGDCLESMVEFRKLAAREPVDDSVLFISSVVSFERGNHDEALELIKSALELSRLGGNLRRVSLHTVKMGSMLLSLGRYSEAAEVLREAEEISIRSNSLLNLFAARVKGTAAECLAGRREPWEILCIPVTGKPDEGHRGEQFYYHWKLTGSRQSAFAAAGLLARSVSGGLHMHSYGDMLHEVAGELKGNVADIHSLVHNYPIP